MDALQFVLSVVLALASAVAFAVANVGQQRAAAKSSDADARAGRFVGQLLRNPQWLAATLGTGVGYVLQAAALGVGSVVVVAPILVTSLLFALPLSARLSRERVSATAVRSGLLLTVSLAVFVVLADPDKGLSHASYGGWLVVALISVAVVGACLVAAHSRSGAARSGLLAITVGLLGGVLAVLTKSVVDAGGNGVFALLTSRETYALVVVGVAGIYLQQLAFQAGALQTSLPIMIVLEPMVAAVLGIALLHEKLRADGMRLAVLIAAAVVTAASTVVLARARASARVVPSLVLDR